MMVRRNKLGPSLVGRAETKLEGISDKAWSRAVRLTALLRPTLGQPLTQSHVERLARAANMSVPHLQRYRKRLAESELTILWFAHRCRNRTWRRVEWLWAMMAN